MAKNRTRCALVTGASSGIGAAFARQLAARGLDLVLTARREERLVALARELEQAHSIRTLVVPADLADREAPERLVTAIDAAGLRVDVLINDAGYGVPGNFLDHPWQAHADSIQVMLTAVAHTTHLLLPGMVERGFGRVVNVASLAALLTGSKGHTLYAATKAFLVKLSESLALELHGTGVHVTACCPGFTYSEFHDVVGNRDQVSELPGFVWMQPEIVARQTLDAVERGQVVFVPGRSNRALAGLARLTPPSVALRMSARLSERLRKQR